MTSTPLHPPHENEQESCRTVGRLPRGAFDDFLRALSSWGRVVGPSPCAWSGTTWATTPANPFDHDAVLPKTPAATWLFPQCEPVFGYDRSSRGTGTIVTPPTATPMVLVGVRSCDSRAIAVLDRLFLHTEPVDESYRQRRETCAIVGRACAEGAPTCWCTTDDLALGPANPLDSDLYLTPEHDGAHLVEVISSRGETLLTSIEHLLETTKDSAAELRAGLSRQVKERQKRQPNLPTVRTKLAEPTAFTSDLWHEVGESCLGCHVCTFLCPTCHCYELRDEGTRCGGHRYRLHDGCMSEEFTAHAGGHNPRAFPWQRWRQRAFHKFSWFPDNQGTTLCVGCGRCTLHCPVGLDLVDILEEVETRR